MSGDAAPSFLSIITRLGQASSLVVCLDAGDAASYAGGSGQTWADRSGSGNSYLRGADNTSSATDPTYNGTANALTASEYFSLDGGDYFTESSNQTFADNWRQNGAAFTILILYYPASIGSNYTFFVNGTGGTPFLFRPTSTNSSIGCLFKVGGVEATTALTNTAWNYCLVSYLHGGGATDSFFSVNNTVTTFDTSAMSTGTPSGTYNIGANNGSANLPNGSRISMFAIWNRNISQAESSALYTAIKARRHPTLP